MNKSKIILCNSEYGDWEGIYIDNKLYVEDHRMNSLYWINLIRNYSLSSAVLEFEIDGEYLENSGGLPDKFTEIPKEYIEEV